MRSGPDAILKPLAATVVALLLLAGSARADSEEKPKEWGPVAYDAVVLRPFNAVSTLVGAAIFVPACVMTAPSGRMTIEEAWEVFVAIPAERAFIRPLGDY